MNHVYRSVAQIVAVVATAVLVLAITVRSAAADNVDKLVKDLTTASDYKLRLSAAASLAKLGDQRAIAAFIKALAKDKEKTVRGAAAVGLGKVVTSDTDAGDMADAIAALEKAAKDKDSFVKKQAKKALDKLKKLASSGGSSGGGTTVSGGIFIDISQMTANAGTDPSMLRELMRKTTEKTLNKNASTMLTKWPGGKSPTKKDLSSSKTDGYHIDGTLISMTSVAKGSAVNVTCKVSMLIATFPDKSMFAFLNGGATVQASNDAKDIALAEKDCVAAVVEDLVIKKIIAAIKAKSP